MGVLTTGSVVFALFSGSTVRTGIIASCSFVRHFTLTVPFFRKEVKHYGRRANHEVPGYNSEIRLAFTHLLISRKKRKAKRITVWVCYR